MDNYTHRLNRWYVGQSAPVVTASFPNGQITCISTFLAAFLQRLYSCEQPIYTPPMGHFALSWHQATFIHSYIVESHLELHLPHICSFNQSRSKTKDLSREKLVCIRSWWSVLAQVKALACYSWWLAAPRRSWWLRCFFRSLPSWLWEPEEVCTWLELHHAGMVNGDS